MAPSLSYCAQAVRDHDNDRYLCALFAPPEAREDVFALLAFNLELARVADVVREPMMGLIRLAWWREAIEEIHAGSTVRRHAVVEPLAGAIRRHALPRASFDAMIEARECDLEPQPFADFSALEAYCENSGGAVHALWARMCAEPEEEARRVGTAWAMVGCARSAARGRLRLPVPVLPGEVAERALALQRQKGRRSAVLAASVNRLYIGKMKGTGSKVLPGAFMLSRTRAQLAVLRAALFAF